jgi:hypothetical protein
MSTLPSRCIASPATRRTSSGWLASGRLLQVAGLARDEQQARAGFTERLGDLQAEAARSAGDDRRAAVQVEQLLDGGAHEASFR